MSLANRLIGMQKSTVVSTLRSRRQYKSWGRRLPRIVSLPLKRWWRHYKRYTHYLYQRFISLEGSPEAIARGIACGVLAGFTPFFGIQTAIAVFCAFLLKGNMLAAAASTWISNPLTYIPIFAINFQVGKLLLGTSNSYFTRESLQNLDRLLHSSGEFLTTLLFGSFVMGLLGAICSYILGLRLIYRLPRWRRVSFQKIKSLPPGDRCDRLT